MMYGKLGWPELGDAIHVEGGCWSREQRETHGESALFVASPGRVRGHRRRGWFGEASSATVVIGMDENDG